MVKPNHEARSVLLTSDVLGKKDLRCVSVDINEILQRGRRLDASYYDIEGKRARQIISNCPYPKLPLFGERGVAKFVYHFPRFKRIFVETGIPIFTSSQILDFVPRPQKFISSKTRADLTALTLREGQIVVTCSGSIGFCSIVTTTLRNRVFSHDLIRIECNNPKETGYVYAFLKTEIGHKILTTNNYGSVVTHIEPEHLTNIMVPDLPDSLKNEINTDVLRSFGLRDEANDLLKRADDLLVERLELVPLERLRPEYLGTDKELKVFPQRISDWQHRLDASFHSPIVEEIVKQIKRSPAELTNIGDKRVSERIILPGRFKRIYVSSKYGIPFLSGGDILQFDPVQVKYLSPAHHGKRISEELTLHQNLILVTCSGTIGNVVLAPKHFEGWTANQHVLRIAPSKEINPGYVYAFLANSYGKELVKRFTYGSVVNEIDDRQLASVEFPLPSREIQDEIGNLVTDANDRWTEAYILEKNAISELENTIVASCNSANQSSDVSALGQGL